MTRLIFLALCGALCACAPSQPKQAPTEATAKANPEATRALRGLALTPGAEGVLPARSAAHVAIQTSDGPMAVKATLTPHYLVSFARVGQEEAYYRLDPDLTKPGGPAVVAPEQSVKKVGVRFDKGGQMVMTPTEGAARIAIPAGATRVMRLEVVLGEGQRPAKLVWE
jgi:hypothetical protein